MSASEFKEGRSVEDVCASMGKDIDKLVQFAKAAEVAERYDDMVTIVKALARVSEGPMTVEQRNLFSVAFKNVVGALRASWRVLDSIRESKEDDQVAMARKFQAELEVELRSVCDELLKLVNRSQEGPAGAVFFQKMAGDYHRYMAEIEAGKPEGDRNKEHAANALAAYKTAYALACDGTGDAEGLSPTNPIRLGLALNFSVFYYEIQQKREEACTMAKAAFDGAISELDALSQDEYKDSTLIMQLIRDNLTLWQSGEDEGGVAPEQDGTAVEDL